MKRFALLLLVVNIPLLVKMNAEKPEVVTAEDVDKVDPHKTNITVLPPEAGPKFSNL